MGVCAHQTINSHVVQMFESQGYVHTGLGYVFTAPQTIHPPRQDIFSASVKISFFLLKKSDLHCKVVSGLRRLQGW